MMVLAYTVGCYLILANVFNAFFGDFSKLAFVFGVLCIYVGHDIRNNRRIRELKERLND